MSDGDLQLLHSVDAQAVVVEAVEIGIGKAIDIEARRKLLRDVDAVLELHRRAVDAGLDKWMTVAVREQATHELDYLSQSLDRALDALGQLSPLAESALRPNLFDTESPIGNLIGDEAGLDAGTRKAAMRVYLDHFRGLVGLVDSVQGMLRVIALERSAEKPEDWPARGFDGSKDGPVVPSLEALSVALSRYAALARFKTEDLRAQSSKRGRPAEIIQRALTLALARIWHEHAGMEPTIDNYSGESPFLRFARASARVVDPSYDGQAALRDMLAPRLKKPV